MESFAEFTQRLQEDARRNYGDLNIVKIAKAIAVTVNDLFYCILGCQINSAKCHMTPL